MKELIDWVNAKPGRKIELVNYTYSSTCAAIASDRTIAIGGGFSVEAESAPEALAALEKKMGLVL